VASAYLERGATVEAGSLKWQPWPESAVNANFITKALDPEALNQMMNATVRVPMQAGEPVTVTKLITLDNTGFMAAVLEPGMRAVSAKISPETGAGGFILPNDRVDVIQTEERRTESGNRGAISRTILKNVRVLAIDQTFRETDGEQVVIGKTATLELTPRQAEMLALSSVAGEVSLSLRSLSDSGPNTVNEQDQPSATTQLRVVRYGAEGTMPLGSAE
jgi:pilus assembly protein CpaB